MALKPIVDAMGLEWTAQFRRVQRDPILKEGIAMMAIPFSRGGTQQTLCLRLDLVNGWLFKVDSTRIKNLVVREKVELYQRECYRVLEQHFMGDNEKQRLESESLRIRMVSEARQTFGTPAAAQLWKKLELPKVPAMDGVLTQLNFLDRLEDRKAA